MSQPLEHPAMPARAPDTGARGRATGLLGKTGFSFLAARSLRPGAAVWLALLAALGVAGLLLAFQQVVSRGVEQGATRQRATAALADANWRCNALTQSSQRSQCQAQLNSNR